MDIAASQRNHKLVRSIPQQKYAIAGKAFPAIRLSAEGFTEDESQVTGQDTKEIFANFKQTSSADTYNRQVSFLQTFPMNGMTDISCAVYASA